MRVYTSVIILLSTVFLRSDCSPLDEVFHNYELLNYSTDLLEHKHIRARRSLSESNFPTAPIRFPFTSFGFNLTLVLLPERDLLSDDLQITVGHDGISNSYDLFDHIYSGFVQEIPGSAVHGRIIDGVFSGSIAIGRHGSYHIEPVKRYSLMDTPFHSVVYHDKHVKPVNRPSFCGTSRSQILEELPNQPALHARLKRSLDPIQLVQRRWRGSMRFSDTEATEASASTASSMVCNLYLRTDTSLWDYVMSTFKDPLTAKKEIISILTDHVQYAKRLFSSTVFQDHDKNLNFAGVSFRIDRIQINVTNDNCGPQPSSGSNPFCHSNIDVNNLLELHSKEFHGNFCLAYLFTYRDFSQGVLGLAYLPQGGVCHKSHFGPSLNTGLVTLLNYGRWVPPATSKSAFVHELGHNFGALHDDTHNRTECLPGENSNGNYIMFPNAVAGTRSNHRLFSPCSKDSIARRLQHLIVQNQSCFTASDAPFCGNAVVETGEQCDCGYETATCTDRCCQPPSSDLRCQLRRSVIFDGISKKVHCSPTAGQCCTQDCQYRNASYLCMVPGECYEASYCTGDAKECPKPKPKPDLTLCNDKTRTCKNGQCIGSLCELVSGYTECTLKREDRIHQKAMCHVACRLDQPDSECVSLYYLKRNASLKALHPKLAHRLLTNDLPIELTPGSPCDNYKGYCDFRLICRLVGDDGPLARYRKALFSPTMLRRVKAWMITKWWAILLISIGVMVVSVVFVKLFSYSTPHVHSDARLPGLAALERRDMRRYVSREYWSASLRPRRRRHRERVTPTVGVDPSVIIAVQSPLYRPGARGAPQHRQAARNDQPAVDPRRRRKQQHPRQPPSARARQRGRPVSEMTEQTVETFELVNRPVSMHAIDMGDYPPIGRSTPPPPYSDVPPR